MMHGDGRVDQIAPEGPKPGEDAILVCARKPGVADNVGDQDYCNPPKSGQFVKGQSGNPRGRPRRPKTGAAGSSGDSEFDAMFREEMKRKVTVREGESFEKISIERAATRAIGLKAAKGDVKAFKAVVDKRGAIDKRAEAQWEELTRTVSEYKSEAALELKRRKGEWRLKPEIIPHPDDIDIDFATRTINCDGPMTLDQKMAQDLMVSTWPERDREMRKSPLFAARDHRYLRQYRRSKREMEKVSRLVAKRASRINSWENATLEVRKDYLRKHFWPTMSENFPPGLTRSELCFLSTFRRWLGIELTKEEDQALFVELREVFRDPSPDRSQAQ
jgi:hypothetical protein